MVSWGLKQRERVRVFGDLFVALFRGTRDFTAMLFLVVFVSEQSTVSRTRILLLGSSTATPFTQRTYIILYLKYTQRENVRDTTVPLRVDFGKVVP